MSTPHVPEDEGTHAVATWREWWGLGVLLLPAFMLSTDVSVLFFAMPSISADLDPGASQSLWILHVYGFFIAAFLVTMGRVADQIGRRRLLLAGATSFAVLSVVAAYSVNAEMLIAARALLGIAGASVMPATFGLLRTMFVDDGQRRLAIATLFSVSGVGAAVGPLLGGALLELFWWGSVFLVSVPPMLLLVLTGPKLLPAHQEVVSSRLDPTSVVLSLAALLGVVYGLQTLAAGQEGTDPASPWPAVVALAVGVALAITFVWRQRTLEVPLLDLELFANRRFSAALLMLLLTGIGLVGVFYVFTQYLQWVAGLSPLQAGLWTLPFVVSQVVGGILAPAITRSLSPRRVIVLGLLTMAVGFAVIAVVAGVVQAPLAAVALVLAPAGLGHGAAMALASDLIVSTVPENRVGSAGAMQEVSGELGAALGIAVGGTIGIVAYRAALDGALPTDLAASVAESVRSSVHEAMAVSDSALGLRDLVRDAYTYGLQVNAAIAAVVVAAVALAAIAGLRERPAEPSSARSVPGTNANSTDAS